MTINIPLKEETVRDLREAFGTGGTGSIREGLQEAIDFAQERYNQEVAELEIARLEVRRREDMDDHLPRFNHPMTIQPPHFPKGRHSPASMWVKRAYINEAEGIAAAEEADVETANFALQRAIAAIRMFDEANE